ncbi:MAG: nitrate reductase [Gammaproteobacteria bacterium]|nr:nitrate reductase [Gammaproteobacteria bacterium]NIR99106.1 nitrate reductase [Gammaproteobacteria bacterium]NIT64738.1 nitrate reductase [Gammaproteobacteria bacterium]NIV21696.1 nitrate reductase [Gammaproteobacteria bacterium]NIX10567.1 nitrate reductase [Gammaproteobacteria bacterium]
MSFLSVAYAVLFYVAGAILVVGLIYRIAKYARTPAPLKIPTTPAPVTGVGVAGRLAREVVFFESLFKATKWTWLFGWIFHLSLLLAFFRHLRYALTPESWLWAAVNLPVVQTFGKYAGYGMAIGLIGLLGRRIFVDRVRYISSPSDYLMLLLLLAIAGSGLTMTFLAHTDVVQLKAWALGILYFDPQPLPSDPFLILHLTLVAVLMIIFPISKLLHAPGLFFSPSRNQVDNARERRHLAPWAAQLDGPGGNP